MNWILEHLQIVIAAAAAIAYFLNRRRAAVEEESDGNVRESTGAQTTDEQAERTRRVQEEIRRKIAERRSSGVDVRPSPAVRERIPPMVRPAQTPPLDPFGGPMRRIIRELEAAAEKRLEPQPDPEEVERAAALERQQRLAAEMRALEAARLAQQRRAEEIAVAAKAPSKISQFRSGGDLRAGLRDRGELRRAIVLREILGAPVGFR